MPKYTVLVPFIDTADKDAPQGANCYYTTGEKSTYPRKGFTPSAERLKQLQGKENKQGKPLISAQPMAEDKPGEKPAGNKPAGA